MMIYIQRLQLFHQVHELNNGNFLDVVPIFSPIVKEVQRCFDHLMDYNPLKSHQFNPIIQSYLFSLGIANANKRIAQDVFVLTERSSPSNVRIFNTSIVISAIFFARDSFIELKFQPRLK